MKIRTGENIKCRTCLKEFYVLPYLIKSGRKKFCSKECLHKGDSYTNLFELGHSDLVPRESRGHSDETIKKMIIVNRLKAKRGKNHHLWKGGSDSKRNQAMKRWEYKEWRQLVFERDKYTCQKCKKSGTYLHADHIKSWSKHPELRYDINNGQTLCIECHYEKTFNKKSSYETMMAWGKG